MLWILELRFQGHGSPHLDQIDIKMRRMSQVSMRIFDSDCRICTSQQKKQKNKQEEDKDPLFTQILIKALTKPRDVVLDTYYGGRLQPPALDGVTRCWTGLHRHYSNQIRLLLHCSFMKAVISISMMFFSNKVIMSRCPRFQVSVPLNPNVKVKYSYRENHS